MANLRCLRRYASFPSGVLGVEVCDKCRVCANSYSSACLRDFSLIHSNTFLAILLNFSDLNMFNVYLPLSLYFSLTLSLSHASTPTIGWQGGKRVCYHFFHATCARALQTGSHGDCPLCRAPFQEIMVVPKIAEVHCACCLDFFSEQTGGRRGSEEDDEKLKYAFLESVDENRQLYLTAVS
jgi:hypothetical protein